MDEIVPVKSDNVDALAAIRAAANQNNALANTSDDVFADMSKGADYLCRLQLQGSNSKLVKLKKIPCGHYAYITTKENFIDLGEAIDVFAITWRPRALDMSGATPISVYDPKSALFKDIAERSFGQDSNCTFGPDFLVWIPEVKRFASLHWGSKTARQDAPAFMALMKENRASTLTCRIIEKPKFVWEAMTVNACSTPFALPDLDKTQDQITKFVAEQNQKAPEKADPKLAGGGRSR